MSGLDESQAGIKIAGRNINNLRYSDNTTLMAENKEEIKSFLILPIHEHGIFLHLFVSSLISFINDYSFLCISLLFL